jgi:hypothetical protein
MRLFFFSFLKTVVRSRLKGIAGEQYSRWRHRTSRKFGGGGVMRLAALPFAALPSLRPFLQLRKAKR